MIFLIELAKTLLLIIGCLFLFILAFCLTIIVAYIVAICIKILIKR